MFKDVLYLQMIFSFPYGNLRNTLAMTFFLKELQLILFQTNKLSLVFRSNQNLVLLVYQIVLSLLGGDQDR